MTLANTESDGIHDVNRDGGNDRAIQKVMGRAITHFVDENLSLKLSHRWMGKNERVIQD